MKFSYKAQQKTGEVTTGVIEAPDRFTAAKKIRENGEVPLSVSPQKAKGLLSLSISLGGKIKLHEKILFARNLAGMLTAGLSLYRAIEVLRKQTKKKQMMDVLDVLLKEIDAGGTLSSGMAKFPNVFSKLFVSMVRAGEESGGLPGNLKEVSVHLEKAYNLNRKIKGALTYPAVILCAILMIGVLMLIFVVPTLTKTFAELNATLPASTRFILFISDSLIGHPIIIFGTVFLFAAGVYFLARIEKVQHFIDGAMLKIPVIGFIIMEVNTARTARTLGSLLSSGIDISKAISITEEVLQNNKYKLVLAQARIKVEKGAPLSEIFKESLGEYPIMVGEMIEVGEETGKLTDMLLNIASFYEEEVDSKTKDLSTIIEPILMIFIGAAVGFFAISMITPMYSLLDSVK